MENLNWVDYLLLLIFLFSIIGGLTRGFVREVIALLTIVAAFLIAIMFSNPLASYFTGTSTVQSAVSQASGAIGSTAAQGASYVALAVAFTLLFVATLMVGAIVSYILSVAFQTGILGFGNRIMGGVFGLVRGYIITLVVVFVVQLTPLGSQSWWHQSQLVASYQPAVQWLGSIVSPSLANLKAKVGQTIQGVGSQIQGITQ